MLNCVNALEQRIPVPPPPTERASLMVSEEKPIPDTCKFTQLEQKYSKLFLQDLDRPINCFLQLSLFVNINTVRV